MTDRAAKIRLFVEAPLQAGAEVPLSQPQAHYLFSVMRREAGDAALVFNGRDGEWLAEIVRAGRRAGALVCRERTRAQERPADLELLFAPVKKARTDFIVEKAAELGAARAVPVFTRFTNAERVRPERLQAIAIEAAEQCGRTSVMQVAAPRRLDELLDGWDPARRIMFCDERMTAPSAAAALAEAGPGPWAALIGPEGGFAEDEARRLRQMPCVVPVTLGPRILRADTAAAAALTLWQSVLGDWR
ncbi:16S rRNA (uracil(1498)-N(3))-methyltransferase [Oceanicella actignis]|uniref:Ribosomal RNA small subunit methyltransferase E n=1 Tax=Oceanicella actignis TaxID=1189325 RepID=A0A1M7TJK1_9RHOB|nr:16S rRNA (uracil(1498)-N(3))-methyltransferase [Oceanicella actignis]SET66817.1 16S rRNA (uracil1498-N3)-methyltransferase [Oceanicella actignis]SHN70924.1 16S rRNA (uracil1498-N3)-methyltransferase [Oceanicella actignis]